jgi:hypothetical protein
MPPCPVLTRRAAEGPPGKAGRGRVRLRVSQLTMWKWGDLLLVTVKSVGTNMPDMFRIDRLIALS